MFTGKSFAQLKRNYMLPIMDAVKTDLDGAAKVRDLANKNWWDVINEYSYVDSIMGDWTPGAIERFRTKLKNWKDEIYRESRETVENLQDSIAPADMSDRATQESEKSLELKSRDRQRKLIAKIDAALYPVLAGSSVTAAVGASVINAAMEALKQEVKLCILIMGAVFSIIILKMRTIFVEMCLKD